ncbi:conserved hypothetical protein [Chloroherpeton thalassium ATCC 35110]|uniref:Helix-hairpin-helix domain-containing protein n=1 Tax=Chloroherpeton thalassium (strain ATCC 35110 / GB-78) TaxID=517418 RepID=B3QS10_CHLT3|nr:helix-hairpin-helix domain-containing protein [Chloroherpeton thalassium]ACF13955.1 conserved hypothetical protein [Chloroherpeton thalassium ATCC 35110]
MKGLFLICVLAAWNKLGQSFAVTPSDSARHHQQNESLERLLDRSSEISETNDALEQLYLLKRQKLDLNTASFQELLSLPYLSSLEAQAILMYREKVRFIKTVSELSLILDEETAALLEDFVTTRRQKSSVEQGQPAFLNDWRQGVLSRRVWLEYIGRAMMESPSKAGFENGNYLGSEPKLYNRLQVQVSENFLFSGLAEKDIGERSLTDFSSFGFQARDIYQLNRFIIGDYHLRFGQGLALTTGRFFFKSAESVASAKQSAAPVRLYTSSAEYNFFRGAASQLSFGNFSTVLFFSKNKIDASGENDVFSSIDTDGLHRTANDLAKQDFVTETLYGTHLELIAYQKKHPLSLGATLFQARFDKRFQPENSLENYYRFAGKTITVGAMDFDFTVLQFNFFGEIAYAREQKAASWLVGIKGKLRENVKAAVLFRDYSKKYYSPHASAFAERGDDARNETGIYFGLQAKPHEKLWLRAYYDFFRFPYLSSNTTLPSSGYDLLFSASYRLSEKITLGALFQQKEKEEALNQTDAQGDTYRAMTPQSMARCRIDCIYHVSRRLTLKSRAEVKQVQKAWLLETLTENGWLIYEQAELDLWRDRFSLQARFAFFETDSYDAAIYAYENDLPLLASVTAHYGSGSRFFLNLRYEISQHAELAFRYANTFREDVQEIGSGNETQATNAPSWYSFGIRLNY